MEGLSAVAKSGKPSIANGKDSARVHGGDQRPDVKKMAVGQMRARNQALA